MLKPYLVLLKTRIFINQHYILVEGMLFSIVMLLVFVIPPIRIVAQKSTDFITALIQMFSIILLFNQIKQSRTDNIHDYKQRNADVKRPFFIMQNLVYDDQYDCRMNSNNEYFDKTNKHRRYTIYLQNIGDGVALDCHLESGIDSKIISVTTTRDFTLVNEFYKITFQYSYEDDYKCTLNLKYSNILGITYKQDVPVFQIKSDDMYYVCVCGISYQYSKDHL